MNAPWALNGRHTVLFTTGNECLPVRPRRFVMPAHACNGHPVYMRLAMA